MHASRLHTIGSLIGSLMGHDVSKKRAYDEGQSLWELVRDHSLYIHRRDAPVVYPCIYIYTILFYYIYKLPKRLARELGNFNLNSQFRVNHSNMFEFISCNFRFTLLVPLYSFARVTPIAAIASDKLVYYTPSPHVFKPSSSPLRFENLTGRLNRIQAHCPHAMFPNMAFIFSRRRPK